ncbi:MAG: hypothetical protein V1882_10495 [Candidatus Omnitrophota bacterium]
MKPVKKSALFVLITVLVLLGAALWLLPRLPGLERDLLERLANQATREFFSDSVRIEKVSLDRHLKIHFEKITGKMKTRQNPVPLEIGSLRSEDSLISLITQKPVRFTFTGMRPQGSPRPGVSGTFLVQTGTVWRFECSADFGKTDLEDWQWLDPGNLSGASGAMKGNLVFRQTFGKEPEFEIDLEAPQPGGNIQAKFFDLFLPYLPTAVQKEKVEKVVAGPRSVRYDRASLKVSLPQSDKMKILLEIYIPAYNLILKLNANLRTDQKGGFSQIAQIMGLIEVK